MSCFSGHTFLSCLLIFDYSFVLLKNSFFTCMTICFSFLRKNMAGYICQSNEWSFFILFSWGPLWGLPCTEGQSTFFLPKEKRQSPILIPYHLYLQPLLRSNSSPNTTLSLAPTPSYYNIGHLSISSLCLTPILTLHTPCSTYPHSDSRPVHPCTGLNPQTAIDLSSQMPIKFPA